MRICFVSRRFFPTISGMSVYAANLLRELVQNNVEVTMIAQYRDDEIGKKVYGGGVPAVVAGVDVIGLESIGEQKGGNFEVDVRRIVETIIAEHRKKSFDILHAQYGYPPGLAVLEASKILGIPNVVSIQGGDGHWVGVNCCLTHKIAMQTVLTKANAILIGSKSFAEEVRENHSVNVSQFTIVPGAVDTNRFLPRSNWRAGEFIEETKPRLLYHGRVDARKGALDLIEAFARLLPEIATKPQLLISGIGPDSENVKALVDKLNLQENVRFLGYADYFEVPQIYRESDIFVSPTYAEGFSNTILEAMASGLAIVSTKAVGVIDCLRDGENALLVKPGNIDELGNALREVLTNHVLRQQIAKNALAECREIYSWEKIGRQIIGIYEDLKNAKPHNDWSLPDKPTFCRYREQPHLL